MPWKNEWIIFLRLLQSNRCVVLRGWGLFHELNNFSTMHKCQQVQFSFYELFVYDCLPVTLFATTKNNIFELINENKSFSSCLEEFTIQCRATRLLDHNVLVSNLRLDWCQIFYPYLNHRLNDKKGSWETIII